jgi:cysteine sulfinate desulfinase/cysteine desulfurase-like protein
VISALGVEEGLANSLMRFSLGRESSLEEVEYVESVLPEIIRRAQRIQ